MKEWRKKEGRKEGRKGGKANRRSGQIDRKNNEALTFSVDRRFVSTNQSFLSASSSSAQRAPLFSRVALRSRHSPEVMPRSPRWIFLPPKRRHSLRPELSACPSFYGNLQLAVADYVRTLNADSPLKGNRGKLELLSLRLRGGRWRRRRRHMCFVRLPPPLSPFLSLPPSLSPLCLTTVQRIPSLKNHDEEM